MAYMYDPCDPCCDEDIPPPSSSDPPPPPPPPPPEESSVSAVSSFSTVGNPDCPCETGPLEWEMIFNGVTENLCTPLCNDYNNRRFLMRWVSNCRWEDNSSGGCGGGPIALVVMDEFFASVKVRADFGVGLLSTDWTLPIADFNCLGVNVMPFNIEGEPAACNDWPATVTLRPVV